jgi:uncharacterized repeat protein (TIGR03809 family)
MLPRGLTADRPNNPVVVRISMLGCATHWTTHKFSTEYLCHVQIDSSRLRLESALLLSGRFMAHHADVHADLARGRDIVSRWCNLAEQRLEYLTELFETGRWRRFHTEQAFLENVREAKAAVEVWRSLQTREASLDNNAIDLSWLGRRSSTPQISERLSERSPPPQRPAPVAAEEPPRDIPSNVLIALESVLADSAVAPSVPDAPALDDPTLPTLAHDVMQERYPLLRNAL